MSKRNKSPSLLDANYSNVYRPRSSRFGLNSVNLGNTSPSVVCIGTPSCIMEDEVPAPGTSASLRGNRRLSSAESEIVFLEEVKQSQREQQQQQWTELTRTMSNSSSIRREMTSGERESSSTQLQQSQRTSSSSRRANTDMRDEGPRPQDMNELGWLAELNSLPRANFAPTGSLSNGEGVYNNAGTTGSFGNGALATTNTALVLGGSGPRNAASRGWQYPWYYNNPGPSTFREETGKATQAGSKKDDFIDVASHQGMNNANKPDSPAKSSTSSEEPPPPGESPMITDYVRRSTEADRGNAEVFHGGNTLSNDAIPQSRVNSGFGPIRRLEEKQGNEREESPDLMRPYRNPSRSRSVSRESDKYRRQRRVQDVATNSFHSYLRFRESDENRQSRPRKRRDFSRNRRWGNNKDYSKNIHQQRRSSRDRSRSSSYERRGQGWGEEKHRSYNAHRRYSPYRRHSGNRDHHDHRRFETPRGDYHRQDRGERSHHPMQQSSQSGRPIIWRPNANAQTSSKKTEHQDKRQILPGLQERSTAVRSVDQHTSQVSKDNMQQSGRHERPAEPHTSSNADKNVVFNISVVQKPMGQNVNQPHHPKTATACSNTATSSERADARDKVNESGSRAHSSGSRDDRPRSRDTCSHAPSNSNASGSSAPRMRRESPERPRMTKSAQEIDEILRSCSLCPEGRTFKTRDEGTRHLKRAHHMRTCFFCYVPISRQGLAYRKHFLEVHAKKSIDETAPCPVCCQRFTDAGIYHHISKMHIIPYEIAKEREEEKKRKAAAEKEFQERKSQPTTNYYSRYRRN